MKKKLMIFLPMLFTAMLLSQTMFAQYKIQPKMKWWYADRFGMFIHFGSYSYLGHGEWAFAIEKWNKKDYQTEVSAKFDPVNFDAGKIARLAKRAGMKYLVITAKHHEGFCMWPTKVKSFTDYTGKKIYDLKDYTKFGKRDILKELADSCRAEGIKFCLYYSILDWGDPTQTIYQHNFSKMVSFKAREQYIKNMKKQLKELITRYHPAVLWFDGDWTFNGGKPTLTKWWTKSDGEALYAYLMKLDPNLIVNNRVCRGFGLGDFTSPEQRVPPAPMKRPWETCLTMNHSWGYDSRDSSFKSTKDLIHKLATIASRDGNFLLNIGPKGDGTVPSHEVAILDSIGNWMDVYGESIYGTTRSPFKTQPKWGVFTKKEGNLYAQVFNWPSDGILKIPAIKNQIKKVYLMNNPSEPLHYAVTKEGIRISVPAKAPNADNSVIVIDVAGLPSAPAN
jgi:alpha-L-fucosidase